MYNRKFPWSGLYIKLVLCVTLLAYPREARADFAAILAFLSTSTEISAITKVVSVTGSILGFFGDKKMQRTQDQILAELQVIRDQNNQVLAKLDDIMQALDKLPGVLRQVVREELKKENLTIKAAALNSHMVRFLELRGAELVDPAVLKKSADEFRGVLSGMKTLSRELMSTNTYGFTCFPIIGRAMLVEFWASRSFNEPAALRQQAGMAYLEYFNAALSPDVEGSIQQYFLSIANLSYKIRGSLIDADRKLQNSNSSIVETGVVLSDQDCIRQLADVMHIIEGDRSRGYKLHIQHVNHRQERSCPLANDPSDRTNGSERFSVSTLTEFPYVDLSIWSEGQVRSTPRQGSKSTRSGPAAVDRAPVRAPDGHMRGREISGPGPILSRFCRDPGLSRDNPLNSGSYGPLRGHTHHITNIASSGRADSELRREISVPIETAFQKR
jgi:hypothetical protein